MSDNNIKGSTLWEETISLLSRERCRSRTSWSSFDSGRGNNGENVSAKVSGEYICPT